MQCDAIAVMSSIRAPIYIPPSFYSLFSPIPAAQGHQERIFSPGASRRMTCVVH